MAGVATGTAGAVASGPTTGVAVGTLVGVVALLWPSSLGDSSLYTEEQLQTLKEGRTRVRLHVEQQADGTLKGYGYNTQKRRDWEMIPVVQFVAQGSRQVADVSACLREALKLKTVFRLKLFSAGAGTESQLDGFQSRA